MTIAATTTAPRPTRRGSIRLLAAGLAACRSPNIVTLSAIAKLAVARGTSGANSDPRPMEDDLLHLFADTRAAAAIGRAYLQDQVAPGSTLVSLRAQVTRALRFDDADLRRQGRSIVRARFRNRIRQDFAEGNVAMVGGWMLSQLEAQACALAYLSATEKACRWTRLSAIPALSVETWLASMNSTPFTIRETSAIWPAVTSQRSCSLEPRARSGGPTRTPPPGLGWH